MKLDKYPFSLATSCLIVTLTLFIGAKASAQDGLKIAVVDMQKILNSYYKTEIEVEKINAQASGIRKSLDERQAALKALESKAVPLNKVYRDTSLANSKRDAAKKKISDIAKEHDAKVKEMVSAQRKASEEIVSARNEMESKLLGEIKAEAKSIVEAEGFDLVFDKSFLPKANKVILYASENVTDLTSDVVTSLNANRPKE